MNNIKSTPIDPRTEWVTVTPKMAESWLGLNEGNRNKRAGHIARLTRDMKAGRWLLTGDTIKFDWNGRLIDGQHRLTSIVVSETPSRILVVRDLDPNVQSVLDGQAKRAARDALFFNGVEKDRNVLAALAKIDIARQAGAMATALSGTPESPTNAEVVQWFTDNDDAAFAADQSRKVYKFIGASPTPLAYAIMVTSRIDLEASLEFFNSTAEGRTNGIGDPRLTLLRTLERDRKNNRGSAEGSAQQIYYILRTWNAWRAGEKLSKLPLETSGKVASIPEPK